MKKGNTIEIHLFLMAIILGIILIFLEETSVDSNTIPVLMYHSVSENESGIVTVTKDKFKEQMLLLKKEGYETLSLDELYACLSGKMKKPGKCVVITFDDGYKDNFTVAYPVLKELGFKGTVFAITKYTKAKTTAFLSEEEILTMDRDGLDIESHTVSHIPLSGLSFEEQLKELKNSKSYLESILHKEVKYAAFPYGKYNKATLDAAEEAGYAMCFTAPNLSVKKPQGIYAVKRIHIGQSYSNKAFLRLVQAR